MKKIIGSGALIIAIAGAVIGGTGAFFSDAETSTGNTFAAGAIDLKVDNESYYNGNKCAEVTAGIWQWQGDAAYPVPGTPCDTSFPASDLDDGLLFFNFLDLKPDDEGEDTISLHAQNDSWMCMNLTLASDDDKSSTEPELEDGDVEEDINNTWDGELADALEFLWWADDGDNVYEEDEEVISEGVQSLTELATSSGSFSVALADSDENVWDEQGPVPADQTVYIAKAWCLGSMELDPVTQDGGDLGRQPNGPDGSGIICDGSLLGNSLQTDGVTLDVAFTAIQSRGNPDFNCEEEKGRTAKLTVIKQVVNDNGGNNVVADFQLFADNGVLENGLTSGVQTDIIADDYVITETGISGYVASFSGDCNASGQITLLPGDVKTCIITNNDLPGNITLIKNVINNNTGQATAGSNWGLRIDGNIVPNNTSVPVSANTPHTINEDGRSGYHFVSITGNPECPAVLGGTATLDEGESITCTITNDDNAPL